MFKATTLFSILSIALLVQCKPNYSPNKKDNSEKEVQNVEATVAPTAQKYKVYKAPRSERFIGAALKLQAPTKTSLPAGEINFKYEVKNFKLGAQTTDARDRGIANSDEGQHIHFINNNDPYSAHYEPSFSAKLDKGNHVILAFLSRSYHEAVKNDDSYVITQLAVGDPAEKSSFDESAQHLFYSRPKGTYTGSETEKLMLDFFLVNTKISESGNKVRATINGEEHILTDWVPYFIEGLEKGELKVRLELIDAKGALIPGPYNDVSRTVTLE